MKIAVIGRRFYREGGAEKSLRTVKDNIREDIETKVFGYKRIGEDRLSNRFLPVEVHNFLRYLQALYSLRKDIKDFNPHLILCQHEMIVFNLFIDKKSVVFLRDYSRLHRTSFEGSNIFTMIINWFFSYFNRAISSKSLERADLIISNSDFLGEKYKKNYSVETVTVYPFVNLEDFKVKQTGEKILHVNPSKKKGIFTTLELARRTKHEFIVVGSCENKKIEREMRETDNLSFLGYIEDMREIYERTKIALVPSQWEEPYGRIPIETGSSGIPSIVSKKGGLPESVGTEKLVVENKVSKFQEKMKEVLKNYEDLSEESFRNSQEKKAEMQLIKLEKAIKKNIGWSIFK
ncbi:glycosyltransferase [Nanohaloarchaea archaeon H01]|nr:glycosyltransferase [Nanohaloarchaea archaeon H01]